MTRPWFVALASACVAIAAPVVFAQPMSKGVPSLGSTPQPPAAAPKAPAKDEGVQPTLRDDRDVIDASTKWLALLDSGKMGEAWDVASPYLKKQVTRKRWVDGLRDMRKPFGKLQSRSPEKFARAHEMPDAPQGDYAIVEFQSTFAQGKRATEQIVWIFGSDEVWRVSGYYIR